MTVKGVIIALCASSLFLISCSNTSEKNSDKTTENTSINANDMKSYISMFEIPATDISRAISFYQALLDINIEKMDVEGMQMGIFPYKDQMVNAVLIQAEGYKPSANGLRIYLNAGDNLQVALDRVEKNGGQIMVPKTAHADESGYFAIFLDSEGNKIGLSSPH